MNHEQHEINQGLRSRLVAMAAEDIRVRDELSNSGALYDGYHPKMERVHKENSVQLKEILNEYGWPGENLVGKDGADAAWIIMQHDIGEPDFIRACLPYLEEAHRNGELSGENLARTIDRIRVYEGEEQLYGTNYDWDEHSELNPYPIEDCEHVDERRKTMGLKPLADDIREKREDAKQRGEKAPADYEAYRKKADNWLRSVGWRK